jgi:lipopolysaccharide exporter
MTDQPSVAGRAVRGAAYYTIASYAMQGIGLLTTPVLARLLTPVRFGAFGLALTLVMFFARVKLWGLNYFIIADPDPDDLQISTQFWLSTLFSTLVLVLIIAAQPILRLIYDQQVLLMTIIIAAFAILEQEGLASTPENMLTHQLKYGSISLLQTLSTLLGVLTSLGFAFWGSKDWALVNGYAVKTTSYCLGVWVLAPRRPRLIFSFERARDLLKQGRHMLVGGLGSFLAFLYDDFAVGTFINKTVLGLYRKAYDLSLVPMSTVGGVLGVASATYSRAAQDRQALSEAVSFVYEAVALIALPASIGLALIAPEFVPLYLGEEWIEAVPMVRILLLYSLFRPLADSTGGLAAVLDRVKVVQRAGIVMSVVMLVSSTALTLLWGANGAAVSAGLTIVMGFYIYWRGLVKPFVDIDYKNVFGPPIAGALLGALLVWVAMQWWQPVERVPLMLYKGGIFSITYALTLLAISRDKLLARLRRLWKAVFGPRSQPADPDSPELSSEA